MVKIKQPMIVFFTLTNIYNIEPTKFPYKKDRSVYHHSDGRPIFGEGNDFGIQYTFTEKYICFTDFPGSHLDILGKGKSIFTGDNDNKNEYFILKELEVYELFN